MGGKFVYPADKDRLEYHYPRGFDDVFSGENDLPFRLSSNRGAVSSASRTAKQSPAERKAGWHCLGEDGQAAAEKLDVCRAGLFFELFECHAMPPSRILSRIHCLALAISAAGSSAFSVHISTR